MRLDGARARLDAALAEEADPEDGASGADGGGA